MTILGSAARLLAKGTKAAASKTKEAAKNKKDEAIAAQVARFKQKHPNLVKAGRLTTKGKETFVNTVMHGGCPCGCGSIRVKPEHVKRMI